MQLTPRSLLLQFGHILQQDLFPVMEKSLGPLSKQLQLVAAVMAMAPVARLLSVQRARTGRPAKDRSSLAVAFIAKAVLNLPTTRDLIGRLAVDEALRRLCGWETAAAIPHESKFSRVFAEFAASQLAQRMHEAIVVETQKGRLIGHIARDSTAIPARERFTETPGQKKEREQQETAKGRKRERRRARKEAREARKAKGLAELPPSRRLATKPKGVRGPHKRAKATERGTRIQKQRLMKAVEPMLAELPMECGLGVKTHNSGHKKYWRGYKLHLDVADGQLPVSAVLTSASVHDSQVAIPLMTITGRRVEYLYELMDSAYDSDEIIAHSRSLKHVPVIAPHPRRGSKRQSQCPKAYPPVAAPEMDWAKQERYKERTMSERVNARLKDEFGGSQIRVRGAAKVMAHLMFGVVALMVDQWLRMGKKPADSES